MRKDVTMAMDAKDVTNDYRGGKEEKHTMIENGKVQQFHQVTGSLWGLCRSMVHQENSALILGGPAICHGLIRKKKKPGQPKWDTCRILMPWNALPVEKLA